MSRVQSGFEYETIAARKLAKSGDIHGMLRELAAAHALAVWADPALLDRYQALETECWQEYEAWKTTAADVVGAAGTTGGIRA